MYNANATIDTLFVNFMCQIDWAAKWPNICSNITLGVFVRVLWMQLTFKLVE